MIVIGRKSRVTLFASVWMAFALPADANDIFIGTLSIEGERVVLRRCDLAQNVYVLRDAEGVSAVAAMRKREPAAKGYWYGEVIGKYIEIEGVDEATAREAFRLGAAKLSVSTMFVKRQVR